MTVGGPCGHRSLVVWCSSFAGSPCVVVVTGKGRWGARRLCGEGRSRKVAGGSRSPVDNKTIKISK